MIKKIFIHGENHLCVCDLMLYFFHDMPGYQTIGEEYVNVIMTDWTKRILPSKLVCLFYFSMMRNLRLDIFCLCTHYLLSGVMEVLFY